MTASDRSTRPGVLAEHRRRKASPSAAIRQGLSHPVIDTDLHTLEFTPLLEEHIDAVGGSKAVDGFRRIVGGGHGVRGFGASDWYSQTPQERRDRRSVRPPWWSLPTRNTLDLATVALPELLHERLEESGTDFAILYPNAATMAVAIGDSDLRRVVTRAMNTYNADLYRPYADRVTPVAAIPLHTPEEGIEELEHAVGTLGLKAALIPGYVRRPIADLARRYPAAEHPDLARHAFWLDTLGLDSAHDYDPFWAKLVELKVAPTTHASGQGWTARSTPSNFMYNHIGHFADAAHAFAKSLFFGGVTRRFPALRIGFLEGGAGWAASLLADIVGHWEKRNPQAIGNYDPAAIDRDLLARLFREHGADLLRGRDYDDARIVETALSGLTGILLHPQQDLVVLDTRSFPEFRAQTIPGAISVPGAEIVDVVRDLAPSPDTLVVASCGGRTRSIIGAQALIAAGLPNRVVSLQNGTMGWTLGGLTVEKGARRRSAPASAAARGWSVAAAAALAERHGVPTIDAATLAAWSADDARTLHRIDVRQPEEYERGHRPGFVSVPGGQLVQETDRHVATLGARIVLADDGSLVRARVTASWLARMGWEVAVLDAGLADGVLELGPRPARVLGLGALDEPADSLIAPDALAHRIGDGGVALVDLGLSSEYRRGHLPSAWFATRGRLASVLDRLPKADTLVLTSPDGALARLAAAELRALGLRALALDGGTRAWIAAGLPLDAEALYADELDDVWLPPRLHPDPEAAMRAYLDWEIDLIRHVGLDPDFRFRDREAASRPAAHHAAA